MVPVLIASVCAAGALAGLVVTWKRRQQALADDPRHTLGALAEKARELGVSLGRETARAREVIQGSDAVRRALEAHFGQAVGATVECDGHQVFGELTWDGERLRFETPATRTILQGQLWFAARSGRHELSGFARVQAIAAGGVMLSMPTRIDVLDCRGPRRRPTVQGPESLGLGFRPDDAERTCAVLELSRSGASVLVPRAGDLPGSGGRVAGDLVFGDGVLLRVVAEVRHVSRLESGVRVGLCFVESPDEGAVSVKDVVQALAA